MSNVFFPTTILTGAIAKGTAPHPDDVLCLRENKNNSYIVFCDMMMPSAHGKRRYSSAWESEDKLSKIVHVTTEAFALLVYENNYESMIDNTKKAKYTESGKDWSKEGINRYLDLCKMVADDRQEDNGKFDNEYKIQKNIGSSSVTYMADEDEREDELHAYWTATGV